MVNQQLFQGFNGKTDLEFKLDKLRLHHKTVLDSLIALSEKSTNQQDWLRYYEKRDELMTIEQEAANKYTEQIWERLNVYVRDYGISQNYDIILGAKGDGVLMYADEKMDITNEVLKYANKKYEGE